MRLLFFTVLFLFYEPIAAQNFIKGKVLDLKTQQTIPYVSVSTEGNTINPTLTIDGKFTISVETFPATLYFDHPLYEFKKVTITEASTAGFEVQLQSKKKAKSELQKGIKLIKKVTEHQRNSSDSAYQINAYQRIKLSQIKNFNIQSTDTSAVAIEKILENPNSFLIEKNVQYTLDNSKINREVILGAKMSGFDPPLIEVLGIDFQSPNLFYKDYTILNNKYPSPLGPENLRYYHFVIWKKFKTNTLLYFYPKRKMDKESFSGLIFIDNTIPYPKKIYFSSKNNIQTKATYEFLYDKNLQKTLPSQQYLEINSGNTKKPISILGGKIAIGRLDVPDAKNKMPKKILELRSTFTKAKALTTTNNNRFFTKIMVAPDAFYQKKAFWEKLRKNSEKKGDSAIYKQTDSLVENLSIRKKIYRNNKFNIGYYPLGKFDLDLKYPIKYNQYEGIRTGIGGITNEKFSDKYRLEGYVVYGFKDERFKFGVGGGILLNKKHNAWFNLNYQDDLKELASFSYLTDRRIYSLFEPRLVNINSYYRHTSWSSSLQYSLHPKFITEIQVGISDINQTEAYRFNQGNLNLSFYQLSEATFAFQWRPRSVYLTYNNNFQEIKRRFPIVTGQYTKGFKGIAESDFSYDKFGLKLNYEILRINQSLTSFLMEGSLAIGTLPLTHLYHSYPNAPTKETILQRFSVAGRRSFETMFFNEFFSDRLLTLQVRHRLKPFNITAGFRPELVLINRYALGDISNIQVHKGVIFSSLKHLYQESGLEINKLFAGFGLSFAYRYGAYHLPKIGDNIAFKFTFYFSL